MDARSHLAPLTGLRFVAALAVGFAHLYFLIDHPGLPEVVRKLLHEGHVGVPFFFTLSGFLLAHTYRDRLDSGRRVGRYLFARFARVWPLHAVVLTAAILFPYTPWTPTWWENLLTFALVNTWLPAGPGFDGANPVTWTLCVEAVLYLSLPVWVWVCARWADRPPAFWLAVAGGLCVGEGAVVLALESRLGMGPEMRSVVLRPPVHLFEFGVGVCLAYAWAGLDRRGWASASRVWGTANELGVVALLVGLMLFNGKVPPFFRLSGYYTPAVGLIVLAFALRRGLLSRLMSARPAVFLGEASYAFYLVHCLIFVHLYRAVPTGANVYLLAAGLLLAAGVAAALLHVLVEAPVRAWLLRPRAVAVTAEPIPMRRAA